MRVSSPSATKRLRASGCSISMQHMSSAVLGALALLASSSLMASPMSFDFDNGPITGTAGTLNVTDATQSSITFTAGGQSVVVTAGISTSNLCCATDFTMAIIQDEEVKWDNSPSGFGGLGVISIDSNDNIEGSKAGSANRDEVLFFDFGTSRPLLDVTLNGDHTDLLASDDLERWGLWTSDDGASWTAYIGSNLTDSDNNLIATGRETLFLDGVMSRYLAVSAVGPVGQVGGYIGAVRVDVPEPAAIALLGLGLLGLGLRRRSHAASR